MAVLRVLCAQRTANSRSDLSNNQLSGTIPNSIGNLTNLGSLCVGLRNMSCQRRCRVSREDAILVAVLRVLPKLRVARNVRRIPAVI